MLGGPDVLNPPLRSPFPFQLPALHLHPALPDSPALPAPLPHHVVLPHRHRPVHPNFLLRPRPWGISPLVLRHLPRQPASHSLPCSPLGFRQLHQRSLLLRLGPWSPLNCSR